MVLNSLGYVEAQKTMPKLSIERKNECVNVKSNWETQIKMWKLFILCSGFQVTNFQLGIVGKSKIVSETVYLRKQCCLRRHFISGDNVVSGDTKIIVSGDSILFLFSKLIFMSPDMLNNYLGTLLLLKS